MMVERSSILREGTTGGRMGTEDAAEELRRIADTLSTVVASGDQPGITEPLGELEEAATRAAKAWSGSWLGYQSRIYYKDFPAWIQ
jgi:hypothetical protein